MLKFEDMKIDKELQELLPVLSVDEYEKLEQSVLKYGILDPIKVWKEPKTKEWIIVDGHNRYSILQKHIDEIDRLYNAWTSFKIMYEEELHNRDEVKQWMLEQQLGRRNLSEVERYEIVQRFKSLFEERAKKNQSAGGKGLTNLTKVNVRKEMAKVAGTSEGTYQKLDKIMQSDNKELKQKLKNREVSVDKVYRMLKNPTPKKNEEVTPQQQIENFDNRMSEIDKEISKLRTEREALMRKRTSVFETLDVACEVKYEFVHSKYGGRDCRFYIEFEGHKEILLECGVYCEETPADIWLRKIPNKYKNDVIMLWKKAHFEDVEYNNRISAEWGKKFEKAFGVSEYREENKEFYKKCFRILAKNFHPDSTDGNVEDMKNLNHLKVMWGV